MLLIKIIISLLNLKNQVRWAADILLQQQLYSSKKLSNL